MNLKKVIVFLFILATPVALFFIVQKQYKAPSIQQKFYAKDMMSKFNVLYLDKNEICVPELAFCNIKRDDFYKNNEENCQSLSRLYGNLIDQSYQAPVYTRYVSPEFGYGLFADEPISKGQMIGEYTGRLIKDSDELAQNKYLFYYQTVLNKDTEDQIDLFIDAEKAGNMMRFANHTTHPNAERRYVPHNGKWHIIFVAVQNIAQDEQIFIDYGSAYWGDYAQPVEVILPASTTKGV